MILFVDSGSTKTNWLLYNTTNKENYIMKRCINPIIQHHGRNSTKKFMQVNSELV